MKFTLNLHEHLVHVICISENLDLQLSLKYHHNDK